MEQDNERRKAADAAREARDTDALVADAERTRAVRGFRATAERCSDEYAYEKPPRRRSRRARRARRRLIAIAAVLVVLIAAVLLLYPRVQTALAVPKVHIELPDSLEGLLPDETLGYNAIDFTNAVLGESREKEELVVMEQDVVVTSKVTQALANIVIFAKSKTMRSYGTGVFTVQLDGLTQDNVSVDTETQIVTVTIPHATLKYVTVDVERTEFDDTQRGWFAFGELKLTSEEQVVLDQSIDAAMHEMLDSSALLVKADEIALAKARELFSPLVAAVSKDFIVKVVMA